MTTIAYRSPNSGFLLGYIAALVATLMAILTIGPETVLVLYILPWFIAFFYSNPSLLLMIWPLFLPLLAIVPDLVFRVSGFVLLPLDPVYFLSISCFAVGAFVWREKLFRSLKENPYLGFFLLMLVAYILYFTLLYGKSAIGEARKFYFFFLFPVLTVFFVKTMRDLHRVLLVFVLGGLCLLVTGYTRLGMGTSIRGLVNASTALTLLFIVLTILIFHLNKEKLINRTVDFTIVGLSVPIILMTQHRTVLMAGALGYCLLLWLYRYRTDIIIKVVTGGLILLAVLGVVMTSVPEFERYTVGRIMGIINPSADRTGSWRIEGWKQQLADLSGTGLLFGEGLGTYYSWKLGNFEVKGSPHNAYIQLLLKFGLFGLMAYILLALRFFRTTLSARRKLPPGRTRAYVDAGIINYGAAHAYMLGYGFQPSMLIFFALAMGTVSLIRYQREATQPT